jgi:hypothetical protein
VSHDVINWKLIEEEELKLKYQMVEDVPMGLKAKHILAVEVERANIIRRYTENLKRERLHEEGHLRQQLSEIADHSQLFVRPDQRAMLAIPTNANASPKPAAQYAAQHSAACTSALSRS